jgi:hypothetical protein
MDAGPRAVGGRRRLADELAAENSGEGIGSRRPAMAEEAALGEPV